MAYDDFATYPFFVVVVALEAGAFVLVADHS